MAAVRAMARCSDLNSFTATAPYPNLTNSDGANSRCGLIVSGSTLFGTAANGGSSGNGTVFRINTDGTAFTNLHSFTAATYNSSIGATTNSDGANPQGGLILAGNILYGTAANGD